MTFSLLIFYIFIVMCSINRTSAAEKLAVTFRTPFHITSYMMDISIKYAAIMAFIINTLASAVIVISAL